MEMELASGRSHLTLIDHIRCLGENGIRGGSHRRVTRVLDREHVVLTRIARHEREKRERERESRERVSRVDERSEESTRDCKRSVCRRAL